ncbi:MAG: hypothetical protein SFT91_04025 [Rickettsiaceae bacterium]|nr:hypothetical protein [Rickettsiaceae bacterium]
MDFFCGSREEISVKQLLDFPNCKHDDLVDSITQFLNYMKSNKNFIRPSVRAI